MDRFWSKIKLGALDDCWEWTAGKRNGYGRFWMNGKMVSAHRAMLQFVGREIPDGMHVCHHCDNPSCVNPVHLFVGSPADNTQDMIHKKRIDRRGERNNLAKLCNEDILLIRSLNQPAKSIAKFFDMSKSSIERIRSRKTWSHVL